MTPPPQVPSMDRLQRRRRLLWWSVMPALVVLCLAAKMLSVGVLAGNASRAFAAGDPGAVAAAAAGLRVANFTEPHKAPFAEGDGLFLAGDFAAARQRFEEALTVAGQTDECVIRVNLVLSIERLGDARATAGDPAAAGLLFAEGLALVEDAPAACFDAAEAGGGAERAEAEAGEKLEQAAERLARKVDQAAAGTPTTDAAETPGQEAPPAEPGTQGQLDELKKSSREAHSERNSGRERDEYLREDDFDPGTDKPW